MEVIYSLIPGMIFFGLVFVGVLIWAIRKGQYEDMEGDGNRIFMDDDEPSVSGNGSTKRVKLPGLNYPDED